MPDDGFDNAGRGRGAAPRIGTDLLRAVWPRLVAAVLAGLVTGGLAAWAYYGGPFYPLSHTFGIWILTVALLSARQPRGQAVVFSVVALLAAVIAFFYGKELMYGIKYPGMPYSVDAGQLAEWGLLALCAGALLGAVFAGIGLQGRVGAIGTAAAVALLAADAYRRASNYHDQAAVLIAFAAIGIAAVLVVAVRNSRQLLAIGAWTVPAAVVGYGLISAPDALEQLLITGSL